MGDVGAAEKDRARRRPLESGDHPQCGGLAAATGAEQREELAVPDRQIEVVDHGVLAELLAHADDFDGSRGQWLLLGGMQRVEVEVDVTGVETRLSYDCRIVDNNLMTTAPQMTP